MDIPWGSDGARKFVTNVGLVTSNGPYGHDIMAAEWTHHVSYSPGLIAVCINPFHATAGNIKETKVFGVSICSKNQNVVSSIAGGSSGKEVDKIAVLKDLGVEFYKAKKIDMLMIKNASLNVECKLVKEVVLGDHIMFVGEAQEVSVSGKEPLAYHDGKYWNLTNQIEKPSKEKLDEITKLVEKHKKS
jgi:flavin reductase (DIM6/NTAB) family NADH-FMN oxidoreductase RutF